MDNGCKPPTQIPITWETYEALKRQRVNFQEKFGRDPGPDDPVFFDPDADTPQPIDPEGLIARVMAKAGLEPEKVYAFRRTGLLVTEENYGQLSEKQREEWDAAIAEYKKQD